MFDELIQYYFDYFTDKKNDGWRLIGSSVCVTILSELYRKFILKKEIPEIETLPVESKTKYWEQAKRYSEEKEPRIKAMKAAYILELITSTD